MWIHWLRLKHLMKLKRYLKYLVTLRHSMNQKPIGSLRLKRLCFVIQRLTLRRIDSLKLRHSLNLKPIGSLKLRLLYLHFLIPIRSMNRKLIGSLKLKRLCFVIQKLTLRRTDSLKLRHWYLLTHLVMWIHLLRLKHLMKLKRYLKYLLTLRRSMN